MIASWTTGKSGRGFLIEKATQSSWIETLSTLLGATREYSSEDEGAGESFVSHTAILGCIQSAPLQIGQLLEMAHACIGDDLRVDQDGLKGIRHAGSIEFELRKLIDVEKSAR